MSVDLSLLSRSQIEQLTRASDRASAPEAERRLARIAIAIKDVNVTYPARDGRVMALSNVDPRQLILEVTENVLMKEPERAARVLSELREFGIRIAVDDFGTGYSSLSHLQRFPVDVIKIDKSFIDPLVQSNSKSVAMVTSIMGLAKSLGLEVIAEGIEHESQLQRLVDLGCNLGQGFLMAHPLDQEAALAAIAQNSNVALLN